MTAPSVTTFLWFEDQAQEAATLYTSLFDDARIVSITPQQGDPQGRAFIVAFELQGQRFAAIVRKSLNEIALARARADQFRATLRARSLSGSDRRKIDG